MTDSVDIKITNKKPLRFNNIPKNYQKFSKII